LIFFVITPTYDDLLAKVYIKIAQILKAIFHHALNSTFGSDKVLVAPIKELQRCKAKIAEYKVDGNSAPYSAYVCDYLRATILCASLSEMVEVLDKLCDGGEGQITHRTSRQGKQGHIGELGD